MGKKPSKRQQIAASKRAAVLGSIAFREWWQARKSFSPTPEDPYRAFMIDIGLYARVHHKEIWKHRTNRMDYPPVDYPRGRKHPRLPSRKQIRRFKPIPRAAEVKPFTPFEKEVVADVEKFVETYHLPMPEIRFEPHVAGGAAYRHGVIGLIEPAILLPKPFVKAGEKGRGEREQVYGPVRHEAGHHAHVAYGYEIAPDLSEAITTPYPSATRAEKERIAWAIAKKYKPHTPIQAWMKKWAFGTYLGTSPPRKIVE